jgi:hypothetical protein
MSQLHVEIRGNFSLPFKIFMVSTESENNRFCPEADEGGGG